MLANIARLQAAHGKVDDVRHALEEMIEESRTADPTLCDYSLFEFTDEPGSFLLEQRVNDVEERLHVRESERLMELGTVLREKLQGPIEIDQVRVVHPRA